MCSNQFPVMFSIGWLDDQAAVNCDRLGFTLSIVVTIPDISFGDDGFYIS